MTGLRRTLLTSVVALIALAGCGFLDQEWEPLENPLPAPDFTLPAPDGSVHSLTDYRGKIVIIEFWATWCGPCRYTMPSLDKIYREYRDRGVAVLLINSGEGAGKVRAATGTRYQATILLDEQGEVSRRYGIQWLPRLFVVDADGVIRYAKSGYGGGLERALRGVIKNLSMEHAEETGH